MKFKIIVSIFFIISCGFINCKLLENQFTSQYDNYYDDEYTNSIYRYKCEPGTEKYKQGTKTIESCKLQNNEIIDTIEFPAGTTITRINKQNTSIIIKITKETNLKGYIGKANTDVGFNYYFKLRYFTLGKDYVIQNISFKTGTIIALNTKAKLEYCILQEVTDIMGFPCKEKTEIKFSMEGYLSQCILGKDMIFKNNLFSKGVTFKFYKNGEFDGEFKECYLNSNSYINKILCLEKSVIKLYDNGQVIDYSLAEDTIINNMKCKIKTKINYYDNGQIKSCILAEDTILNGIKCKKDRIVEFLQDGQIAHCILAEDTIINGIECEMDHHLYFNPYDKTWKHCKYSNNQCTCYNDLGQPISCEK